MRLYKCDCGHPVFFENTVCLSCGAAMGFDVTSRALLSLESSPDGLFHRKNAAAADTAEARWKYCANLNVCGCNWLLPASATATLCDSCLTNRTIPALTTPRSQMRWQRVEAAK